MAKNLRQKIPKEDTLYIQDVNAAATSKFVEELAGHSVVVAKSAREVAEKAVSPTTPLHISTSMMKPYFPFSNCMTKLGLLAASF
jgi:hypothetical protein